MSSVGRLLGCIAWMRGMCDAIPMRLKSWRDVDMPYLVYVTSYPLLKSSWRRHDASLCDVYPLLKSSWRRHAIPMWRHTRYSKVPDVDMMPYLYVTSYPLLKSSWRRHDVIPMWRHTYAILPISHPKTRAHMSSLYKWWSLQFVEAFFLPVMFHLPVK